jgi:hypothetical protein
MRVEGMVHALEEIRRLLQPDGYLIDIHPIRDGMIKILQQGDLLFSSTDPGYDTDGSIKHADRAIEQVIQRGLYLVERTEEFEVITYASSAGELQDYWAKYEAYNQEPKDDVIVARQNDIYAKATEIMKNAPLAEISYHETVRITRLIPNTRS